MLTTCSTPLHPHVLLVILSYIHIISHAIPIKQMPVLLVSSPTKIGFTLGVIPIVPELA
jgi:hypothetical protein